MIDETTDVSNMEQVVICFRWVDQSLEAHEELHAYRVESTESEMLIAIIHDVLQRLNISVSKLRGSYDGASAMSKEWLLSFSRKNQGLCTHTAMAVL